MMMDMGMAPGAYNSFSVEYLTTKIYYPHDGSFEKEGVLEVKLGEAWEQRLCAVRNNYLFIFNDHDEEVHDMDSKPVSLSDTTTKKKQILKDLRIHTQSQYVQTMVDAVFVLCISSIFKYLNRQLFNIDRNENKKTSVIPLEYAVVQRGHESGGTRYTFIVYHADDRSGSYHFSQFLAAKSETDRDDWIHILSTSSTNSLYQEREQSANSVTQAAEELESVQVQLAAEQEQRKRIMEMLEAQNEVGRALTVRLE